MIYTDTQKPRSGFTLVEIIVVLVVLGILATITVVSYAAVTKDARHEAVIADAQGVGSLLTKFKAANGRYPDSLSELTESPAGESTYQYSYKASDNTYCVTASSSESSAYITSDRTKARDGGCPGHGVNGEAAVVNLATNPNATTTQGFGFAGASGGMSVQASGGVSGGAFMRRSFTAAGNGGSYFGTSTTNLGVTPGKTYTASMYVKSSKTVQQRIAIEWKDSSSILSSATASYVNIGTSWQRLNVTAVAPANAVRATVTVYTPGTPWAAGDYQDLDAVMVTEGSTLYKYVDPDSSGSNWVWDGTANASTSRGPGVK